MQFGQCESHTRDSIWRKCRIELGRHVSKIVNKCTKMYICVYMCLWLSIVSTCDQYTHTHAHTRTSEKCRQSACAHSVFHEYCHTFPSQVFFFPLFVYFVRFILALFCSFRSHRIALKRTHKCVCVCVRSSLCECGCDVYCYVLLLVHRVCASIIFFFFI